MNEGWLCYSLLGKRGYYEGRHSLGLGSNAISSGAAKTPDNITVKAMKMVWYQLKRQQQSIIIMEAKAGV